MPLSLKKAFKVFIHTSRVNEAKMNKETNFDKSLNYDDILEILRKDFLQKWDSAEGSPVGSLDDYDPIAVLGVGSFGKVKLCKHKQNKQYVAVKYLLKEYLVKQKQVQHVINEKHVLQAVSFPFLVSLEFSRKDNDYLYLGMPFYNGGELFSYHRKVRKFKEHQAKFYASQVFLGLEYLHSNELIYRDLKPENILLDHRGYIKITDFGFTKRVKDRTLTLCGTPEYFAPELIQAKPYGTSVDWWAFGIFVFEMVAGFSPFSEYNRDMMDMYAKICECDYRMPTNFSSQLKHLVHNLLQVDLSKRLGNMVTGNKAIKTHEWFETINWFAILNQDFEAPFIPKTYGPSDTSNFDVYPNSPDAKSNFNKYADYFAEF